MRFVTLLAGLAAFFPSWGVGNSACLLSQTRGLEPITRPVNDLTRSFQVRHLPVESAAQQVRQVLLPSEGRVFFDRARNLVVVKGSAAAQQVAHQLLQTIDRPALAENHGPETRRYAVDAPRLGQQAALLSRRFPASTGVQIRPDMARSQLLIVAPREIHLQISKLLMPANQREPSGNWASRIQERPAPLPQIQPSQPMPAGPAIVQRPANADWQTRNATAQRAMPRGGLPGSAIRTQPLTHGIANQASVERLPEPVRLRPEATATSQPAPTPAAPELASVGETKPTATPMPYRSAFPSSNSAANRPALANSQNEDTAPQDSESARKTAPAARVVTSPSTGTYSPTMEDQVADTLAENIGDPSKRVTRALGELHSRMTSPVQDFFQGIHDEVANTLTGWTGGDDPQETIEPSEQVAARVVRRSATGIQADVSATAEEPAAEPPVAARVVRPAPHRPQPMASHTKAPQVVTQEPKVAARVVRTTDGSGHVASRGIPSASTPAALHPMAGETRWRGAFPSARSVTTEKPAHRPQPAQAPSTSQSPIHQLPVQQAQRPQSTIQPATDSVQATVQPTKVPLPAKPETELPPTLAEVKPMPVLPPLVTREQSIRPLPAARTEIRQVATDQATNNRAPQEAESAVPLPQPVDVQSAQERPGSVLVKPQKPPVAVTTTEPTREPAASPVLRAEPAPSVKPTPSTAVARRSPEVATPLSLPTGNTNVIKLIDESDAEIGRYVARFLKLHEEDSDLAGCDIRMAINNRQIWLVLKRTTGTVVKVHIGEIRIDENGSNLFLQKPSSF